MPTQEKDNGINAAEGVKDTGQVQLEYEVLEPNEVKLSLNFSLLKLNRLQVLVQLKICKLWPKIACSCE